MRNSLPFLLAITACATQGATEQPDAAPAAPDADTVPDAAPGAYTLRVDTPSEGQATNQSTIVVRGRATGDGVTVRVANTAVAVDPNTHLWQATLPLDTSTPCNTPSRIHIAAIDADGRAAVDEFRDVVYDRCPPHVIVNTTNLYDERQYSALFDPTSFAPCFLRPDTADVALAYDINAASPPIPVIWKYASNTGKTGVAACSASNLIWPAGAKGQPDLQSNPIHWEFMVSDEVVGDYDVKYQIKAPDKTLTPAVPRPAGPPYYVVGDNLHERFSIDVTAVDVPALASQEGVWEIDLYIQDRAGNALPMKSVQWIHRLLGGPIYVEDLPYQDPGAPWIYAPSYGAGGGGTLAPLDAPSGFGKRVFVHEYRLHNGTNQDLDVEIMPVGSVAETGTIRTRNPLIGSPSSVCTDSLDEPPFEASTPFSVTHDDWIDTAGFKGPLPAHTSADVMIVSDAYQMIPGGADFSVAEYNRQTWKLYGTGAAYNIDSGTGCFPALCGTQGHPGCSKDTATPVESVTYLHSATVTTSGMTLFSNRISVTGQTFYTNPQTGLPFTNVWSTTEDANPQ